MVVIPGQDMSNLIYEKSKNSLEHCPCLKEAIENGCSTGLHEIITSGWLISIVRV